MKILHVMNNLRHKGHLQVTIYKKNSVQYYLITIFSLWLANILIHIL